MVYFPGVVPTVLFPPLHETTPPASIPKSANMPSLACQRDRRAAIPKSRMQQNAAPPLAYQGAPGGLGDVRAAFVGDVVVMVSIAVPAAVLEMRTGLVEPKLNVGADSAPVGLEATEAVRITSPVKSPAGVTVMVEVLPVVAPSAMVTAEPLTVKVGFGGAATVTDAVPETVL